MKKGILIFAVMICVSAGFWAADVITKDISRLPEPAQTFLKTHFQESAISEIEIDKDDRSYDVKLKNRTKIEFDKKGNWKEVDCKNDPVPSSIIPAGITAYVNSNYKDRTINKIEKERWGYEVELNDGLSLEFNRKGEFMRIDY